MGAEPHHVLDTLTDVDACQEWSPVSFEIDEPDVVRLRTGTRVGVSGSVVGRRIRFRLEVLQADAGRLRLRAIGPVELVAQYDVRPAAGGCELDAALSVHRRRGPFAALVTAVATALLGAGALERTLARIAREAERRQDQSVRVSAQSRKSRRSANRQVPACLTISSR